MNTNRGYSSSKKSTAHLYIGSGSKQSPTFRPNYQSSAASRRSSKALKPPRKKKTGKDVIGKDSEGNSILSRFQSNNVTIDFIDDKPKNYQRKRISIEDEERTKNWLRRINFHSYVSDQKLDLMEDAFRNGVLLCELLCFLENIQIYDICYKPKIMKDCRDNIDKAISI